MPTTAPTQYPTTDLTNLVLSARDGDDVAWRALHHRFDRMVRRVARSYRLTSVDVDDVSQSTWLRLFGAIDRVSEPNAIAGWLATTARRESMRVLQSGVREHLTDCIDDAVFAAAGRLESNRPEHELIEAETRTVLNRALMSLSGQQREVLTLIADSPDASYQEISKQLRIPVGSIGPTRARAMARLERHPELRTRHCVAG